MRKLATTLTVGAIYTAIGDTTWKRKITRITSRHVFSTCPWCEDGFKGHNHKWTHAEFRKANYA